MNKKKQRLLSVLVAVLLLFSVFPVTSLAAGSSVDITASVAHPHTVTVLTPHTGGQVIILEPLTIYKGDEIQFTATPDSGYVLKSIVWYTTDPAQYTDITEAKKLTMPDADVNVKVEFAQLFTVSFDLQGHGTQINPITDVQDGSVITAPAVPTAEDYTFGGWYREAGCKTAWNFGADKVTANTTLYAKWIAAEIPLMTINGTVVKEEDQSAVSGATVELFRGTSKLAATETDNDGKYSFTNVVEGTYNIVVTDANGKTKTELVKVNAESANVTTILPKADVSSKVECEGEMPEGSKTDVTQISIGGLDDVISELSVDLGDLEGLEGLTGSLAEYLAENPDVKVSVQMEVAPKEFDEENQEQQSIMEEAGEGTTVEFFDLSLMLQIDGLGSADIGGANSTLLTLVIPFDFSGVPEDDVVRILRVHDGVVETLTEEENADGEYIEVDRAAGTITLHVMKFSEYACAYGPPAEKNDCTYTKKVSLSEGTFGMKLGGRDMGKFTFEKKGSGWSIQNSDDKYLTMKDGKLAYSATADTAWTYKNGAFSTTVKTTQKTSGHWVLFIYVPGSTKTVTTTYYLSTVNANTRLSTSAVKADLYQTITGDHVFGDWIDCKDGENHMHVCKNCGEVETEEHYFGAEGTADKCEKCDTFNPACKSVDVSATYKTKTQKQYVGFWPFGYYKNVTTYTAAVKVNAEGMKVTKVEVSANQNKGWTKSNTFTSNSEIEQFFVRVTTSDGAKHLFRVVDGIGYPAN